MSANVETRRQECARVCRVTRWRNDNPWGHSADSGDVRRCEHGKLWIYADYRVGWDYWRRIDRIFEPLTYRRAAASLPVVSSTPREAKTNE